MTTATLNDGTGHLLLRTLNGSDTLQWRSAVRVHTHAIDRRVLELPLVDGDPIRTGGQWQNRPNRHGLYYWAPTQTHVWHESALESACLMALEFQGGVDRIAAQPFRLLFGAGASAVRHDPDFFAVHSNGDQVVYDVKPVARMTADAQAQFAETARICAAVGWRHEVLHEPDPVLARNLDFLRAARHRRCHPTQDVVVPPTRHPLTNRATDLHLRQSVRLQPLSVSADRIGAAAMRCAAILSGLTRKGIEIDRTGRVGPVVEVYPAAALKVWGLPHQGYKGREPANARRRAESWSS